jgi:hypothetical protein
LARARLTAGRRRRTELHAISGLAGALTVTGTTRYTACPGNSASQGCVVGGLIAPGALSTLTVPLMPPNTLLTPRTNQVDMSIAKRFILRPSPHRSEAGHLQPPEFGQLVHREVDDLHVDGRRRVPATAFDGSSGSYRLPGSILQGRLLRVAAVVNW